MQNRVTLTYYSGVKEVGYSQLVTTLSHAGKRLYSAQLLKLHLCKVCYFVLLTSLSDSHNLLKVIMSPCHLLDSQVSVLLFTGCLLAATLLPASSFPTPTTNAR